MEDVKMILVTLEITILSAITAAVITVILKGESLSVNSLGLILITWLLLKIMYYIICNVKIIYKKK